MMVEKVGFIISSSEGECTQWGNVVHYRAEGNRKGVLSTGTCVEQFG
jgi:hypothetical protein